MNQLLEGFKDYLRIQSVSVHTLNSYLHSVGEYITWYEKKFGLQFKTLHKENISEYIKVLKLNRNQKGKLISPRTVNAKLSGLRTFNQYLKKEGLIEHIIIGRNSFQKVQNSIASPVKFEKEDVEKFFQVILECREPKNERECMRDYALAKLMALTGCRISEALMLSFEDINLEFREITIRYGKGNKTRVVYMNNELSRILKRYLKDYRCKFRLSEMSPYIFLSNRSMDMKRAAVNRIFKKYSYLANLQMVLSPHDLRHYFCSQAIKSGLSIHEVANICGHSSINTTSIYTNVSRKELYHKMDSL